MWQRPLTSSVRQLSKPIFISLALSLCIFVAGIAGTIYVATSLRTELWVNDVAISASRNFQFDAQNAASLQLHNIEAAQRGDVNSVIRTNCILLRFSLRGLEPKAFGPAREAEVKAFIERANSAVGTLESQGLCDLHSK